ncbi:MAG: RagB/SusD family nutrient uptake outer membrane protein, partial [Bacteroides sp.]
MNTKIFKHIIPALSLALMMNFTSCIGDLDVSPIDPNLDVVFNQDANFAKIYAGLAITGNQGPAGQPDIADTDEGASGLMRMMFNINELTTDEAICAWTGDTDVFPLNSTKFTPSNGVVLNMFNRLYIQIAQCNNFLIQTAGLSDEKTALQRAEVRFIRALDYYYLVDLYGNVPFVDEVTGIGAYVPERITRPDLFAYVEKELKEIEPALKAPRSNEYGRADQAAVWMLLS